MKTRVKRTEMSTEGDWAAGKRTDKNKGGTDLLGKPVRVLVVT